MKKNDRDRSQCKTMTAFKRIRGIASKDFLEMTRDGRFRWSGAILSMLTLMSIAVGVRTFLDVDRQQRDAQAEARTHWEGQGEKNPHAAAHYGMTVEAFVVHAIREHLIQRVPMLYPRSADAVATPVAPEAIPAPPREPDLPSIRCESAG